MAERGGQGGESGKEGRAVAVDDALDVGRRIAWGAHRPVHLEHRNAGHSGAVFPLVAVHRCVALVVVGLAQKPLEDARRVLRITHTALWTAAVP